MWSVDVCSFDLAPAGRGKEYLFVTSHGFLSRFLTVAPPPGQDPTGHQNNQPAKEKKVSFRKCFFFFTSICTSKVHVICIIAWFVYVTFEHGMAWQFNHILSHPFYNNFMFGPWN